MKHRTGGETGIFVGSTGIQEDGYLSAVVEGQQIYQKLLTESQRIAEVTYEVLGNLSLAIGGEGLSTSFEQLLAEVSTDGDDQSVGLELNKVLFGIANGTVQGFKVIGASEG